MPVSRPAVHQMYETAVPFFELAAQVQPQEVKWHLMVASCFRRTGNQQQVRVGLDQSSCKREVSLEQLHAQPAVKSAPCM